jgi:hypothetical protein
MTYFNRLLAGMGVHSGRAGGEDIEDAPPARYPVRDGYFSHPALAGTAGPLKHFSNASRSELSTSPSPCPL